MQKGLLFKYMQSNYKTDDFKRGKSTVSKKRHRRFIKSKAKRLLNKELSD